VKSKCSVGTAPCIYNRDSEFINPIYALTTLPTG